MANTKHENDDPPAQGHFGAYVGEEEGGTDPGHAVFGCCANRAGGGGVGWVRGVGSVFAAVLSTVIVQEGMKGAELFDDHQADH